MVSGVMPCRLSKTGIFWARAMIRLTLLWTLSLFAFPLLVIQAWYAKRNAVRLPEGKGPREGRCLSVEKDHSLKSNPPEPENYFSVLGIGDSVTAGVGCRTMAESLVPRIAFHLSQSLDRAVEWRVYAANGARLAEIQTMVAGVPLQSRVNLVVVSAGVNDVTNLTSLMRWQLELAGFLFELREKFACPVVILDLPPMGNFTAVPQPLRFVLGVRAAMLSRVLIKLSGRLPWVSIFSFGKESISKSLADDGYHPSPEACEDMARMLVRQVTEADLFSLSSH